MKISACVLLVLFFSFIHESEESRIFLISNLPSGSHAIWFGKLANLLGQRGHEVVILGTGPYKSKSSNVTFNLIEDAYNWIKEVEQIIEGTSLVEMVSGLSTPIDNIKSTSDWSLNMCERMIKSQGTKMFMDKYKNTQFDLIIIDFACDSFLGFVDFFGSPPFIIATPYNNAFNIFDSVGLFDNPSYVPMAFSPFKPEMTFVERALNLYYRLYSIYLWRTLNIPKEDALAKEVFGNNTPPVMDILTNTSLLLVGIDPVLTGAKPLPPAFIPVGGFHIDKVKPLPQDIKKFMDDAKEGVIYFSFGSNFKSTFMTPTMISMFLEAFKELPQRVVWKLELDNRTGIPDNVLISKWLPQNDVLGHPNVRCFISHGGLLGTQEAIHHGVPILSLPFMFDQLDIAKKMDYNGVAIRMEFDKISKSYIQTNLNKIMQPSYRNKMKDWSRMFKDAPQTPEERAIWWIEYVLRNPKDTKKYLRSASMKLYWFQRLMLDVAAVTLLPLLVVIMLLKFLIKTICSKKQTHLSTKKNKKE